MADYRYTALDRAGKQVTGTLSGRDDVDAAGKVRSLGYFPVEVKVASGGGGGGRAVIGISGNKTRPNIDGGTRAGCHPVEPVKNTRNRVKSLEILFFKRCLL
jgi:hypothetical protein